MADISDDKAALAYLLKQVLLADADAPIALALKQAGVQTASGLMSLEVSQDMPLMYDHPAEGSDKAKENIPLLPAEMCRIRGLKDYIRYHMTNVTNKYYESLEDWEKLTAKNFVSFRVNIAVEMNRILHSGVPSSTRVICSVPMSFFVSYGMLAVVTTTRFI